MKSSGCNRGAARLRLMLAKQHIEAVKAGRRAYTLGLIAWGVLVCVVGVALHYGIGD